MSDVLRLVLSEEMLAEEMSLRARLGMAEALKAPLDEVHCTVYLSGKKVSPEFSVDADRVGLTPDEITQALREVWKAVKPELEVRLVDLRTYRGKEAEKEAGEAATANTAPEA